MVEMVRKQMKRKEAEEAYRCHCYPILLSYQEQKQNNKKKNQKKRNKCFIYSNTFAPPDQIYQIFCWQFLTSFFLKRNFLVLSNKMNPLVVIDYIHYAY